MTQEQRLLNIIESIYQAALGEDDWSNPLSALADLCDAENAALVRVDHGLGTSSVVSPRADPDVIADYNRDWWLEDPTVRATATAAVGRITSLKDTGRRRFLNSRFHNEFWNRSGLGSERLAVNLSLTGSGFASCVVQASARRDEIGAHAEHTFALLTPHLVRAVAIQNRIEQLTWQTAAFSSMQPDSHEALLAVDAQLRIQYASDAASALLVAGAGLQTRSGSFRLADPQTQNRLEQAVAACAVRSSGPNSSLLPWRRGGRLPLLTIEVVPWSETAFAPDSPGVKPAALLLIRGLRSRNESAKRPLLDRLKHDIDANLGNPGITLTWLATRHGIGSRRIRELFYRDGTSFTKYLIEARLDRAHELLASPDWREASVSAIALECGFGDTSWFHHTFRRHFGKTPAEVRRTAGSRPA